jgi:hypothetical protein
MGRRKNPIVLDPQTQSREFMNYLARMAVQGRIKGVEKLLAEIKNTPGDPRQADVVKIERMLEAIRRQRMRGDHELVSANLVNLDRLLVTSRERLIAPMVQHAIRGKANADRLKDVGKKPNRKRNEDRAAEHRRWNEEADRIRKTNKKLTRKAVAEKMVKDALDGPVDWLKGPIPSPETIAKRLKK